MMRIPVSLKCAIAFNPRIFIRDPRVQFPSCRSLLRFIMLMRIMRCDVTAGERMKIFTAASNGKTRNAVFRQLRTSR